MIKIFVCFFLSISIFAEEGTLKIGAVFPMTGPIATFGQESVNGIKLALEKINAKGIKGKKIELIVEDNKGEAIDSANATRKLIEIDNVLAILGSVASSNTLASAPVAQSKKVPLVTPASTNEKVTTMGDYISRVCFTDNFQGKVMAKFARNTLKAERAALLIDNSSDYSKGLAEVFQREFIALGGKIVGGDDLVYQQRDVEFRTLLRKIKRANPQVVFVPGYYSEVGPILNQARQVGIDIPFLGGDGWDSPNLQELAGAGVKNTFISSHFAPDDKDTMVQNFVKLYKERYEEEPGAMAALGYDSIILMADALGRVKDPTNREELKNAINSTKDLLGVTGRISIDENRNAVKSAVVLEYLPGGRHFKEKISP